MVRVHADAHVLGDGAFLVSGAIERQTAYESGLPGHVSFRGDVAVDDPLVADERFLAAHVRGRGLTVLSACSHAGIVNACLGALAAAPGVPVDLVLGGYHLAGATMESRIPDTVRDLAERIDPRLVAPVTAPAGGPRPPKPTGSLRPATPPQRSVRPMCSPANSARELTQADAPAMAVDIVRSTSKRASP